MPKILRKKFIPFAADADTDQVAQIGSLRAGTPLFSKDTDVLQALQNYRDGWFGIAMGENSPAIEDMNAIQYVFAYMLSYLFQAGVPEWDASTTYYIGSFVNNNGTLFVSLANDNLGNLLTDGTKWAPYGGNTPKTVTADYSATVADQYIRGNAAGAPLGLLTVTLPASAPLGTTIKIKNISDPVSSGVVKVKVANTGTETIDGATDWDLASNPGVMEAMTVVKGATNVWDIL